MAPPASVTKKKSAAFFAVTVLTVVGVSAYLTLVDPQSGYRLRRCLPAAHPWYACFGSAPFDFTSDVDGLVYQGNTRNGIDREILFRGAYERHVLHFLRDAVSRGGVFVDVGANTGQHSLFMSRYAQTVHAFEPFEPVLQRFRAAIEANGIRNIVVHPVGLGETNTSMTFYRPPDENLGSGSFVQGFRAKNTEYDHALELVAGDDELERTGVPSVAAIKIDVEGFEKPALKGLRRTLTRDRPVVVFELSIDPDTSVSFRSMEELRSSFPDNYELLTIDRKPDNFSGEYVLELFNQATRFDVPEQYNLVAYPIERVSPRNGG